MLSHKKYKKMCREIIRDFDNLPMTDEVKPRVGVVGEILVKFLPAANNYVVDLLEAEGAEAVVPDLTDFLLYCCYNTNFKADYLGASKKAKFMNNRLIAFFEWLRRMQGMSWLRASILSQPLTCRISQSMLLLSFRAVIRPVRAGS